MTTDTSYRVPTQLLKNTALTEDLLHPGKSVRRIHLKEPGLPGLHLVIAPNGTATWALTYAAKDSGQRKSVKLGRALVMDRKGAVEEAAKARDKVMLGVDLKQERIDNAAAHAADLAAIKAAKATVRDVIDARLAELKRRKAAGLYEATCMFSEPTPQTLARKGATRTELKPILKVMNLPAHKLDRKAAARILAEYEKRGLGGALHFLQDVRASWTYVLNKPNLAADMGISSNPWAGLKVSAEPDVRGDDESNAPTRAVSVEEFIDLTMVAWARPMTVNSTRGQPIPVEMDRRCVIATMLIALTGQRVQQVLRCRPEHLDLAAGEWRIPFADRKTRGVIMKGRDAGKRVPHVVALNDHAIVLFREALAIHSQSGSVWLFPQFDRKGQMTSAHRTRQSFNQWLKDWIRRAGGQPFDGRDLRRSWATWCASWGIPFEVREAQMDHALPGVAGRYDFHTYLPEARAAASVFSAKLKAAIDARTSTAGNVVTLAKNVATA